MNLRDQHVRQELLSIRSGGGRGVALPSIVLVRIGVVVDTSDHKTGKVVHWAGRFYLQADTILADIGNNLIARSGVFNKRVAGYDGPVVDLGLGSVSRIALNLVSCITAPTVRAGDVIA